MVRCAGERTGKRIKVLGKTVGEVGVVPDGPAATPAEPSDPAITGRTSCSYHTAARTWKGASRIQSSAIKFPTGGPAGPLLQSTWGRSDARPCVWVEKVPRLHVARPGRPASRAGWLRWYQSALHPRMGACEARPVRRQLGRRYDLYEHIKRHRVNEAKAM